MEYPYVGSSSMSINKAAGTYVELIEGKHNKYWGFFAYPSFGKSPSSLLYLTFWGRCGRTPQGFKSDLTGSHVSSKHKEKIKKGYKQKSDLDLFKAISDFAPYFVKSGALSEELLKSAADQIFVSYHAHKWNEMLKGNITEAMMRASGMPDVIHGDQLLEALAGI